MTALKKVCLWIGFLIVATSDTLLAANNPSNIPSVNSITMLRSLPALQYQTVYLTQYNATTKKGSGEFNYNGSSSCSDDGGVLIQASGGCYSRKTGGQPYDITWFGAQCGGQQVTDGVSSVSGGLTHTITSATATWTTAMVGWRVVVNKAAASGNQVDSTIVSVTPPGTLTYAATTGAANTGETVSVYPDDTTAINAAVLAAGHTNAVSIPHGATCGLANPGSHTFIQYYGPTFYLNGGKLWLGQTGPTTNNGTTLALDDTDQNVVGPGIIDGLYQTNQGIAQAGNAYGVALQKDVGTAFDDGIIGNVVIQNTKGPAFFANTVRNLHITDLTVQNIGDFNYVAGMGDPQTGRSIGGIITQWSGALSIKGYTALSIAQSGILISGSTDANAHAAITDAYFDNVAYYGLDVESNYAAIDATNLTFQNNGSQVIARGYTYGGAIFLNNPTIHLTNVTSNLIDANAIVLEESSPTSGQVSRDWSLNHFLIKGTASSSAGSLYIQIQNHSPTSTTKVSVENGAYDTFNFVTLSTPGCTTTVPLFQALLFNNIVASGNYSAAAETTLSPVSNPSDFTYLMGSNSYLGTVNIVATHNNTKALYFDWSKVYTNGAITFNGSATSSIDAGAIAALPGSNSPGNTSFSCP